MSWWTRRVWMSLAALNGFASVAIGAFAAHGVHDAWAAELLRTGAQYAMVHSLAVLACGAVMGMGVTGVKWAPAFFLVGVLLFSGSLYALALGAPRLVGIITPFGGTSFLIGWGLLTCACLRIDRA